MESFGYVEPDGYDQVVFRGDADKLEFIAFWLAGGRVLAGMNVNVWDVTGSIGALVRSAKLVDRTSLAEAGCRSKRSSTTDRPGQPATLGTGSGRRGQELAAGCRHDAAGGDRRDQGGDQRDDGDGIPGRAWGPGERSPQQGIGGRSSIGKLKAQNPGENRSPAYSGARRSCTSAMSTV
jgi:hypothetical protein